MPPARRAPASPPPPARQRLGQNLPRLGRLNVDGGIVMNAPVEQQPFINPAGSSTCAPPSVHRCRDCANVRAILPRPPRAPSSAARYGPPETRQRYADRQVRFASEGAKPFLHAKIVAIILQKLNLVSSVHITDYRRAELARGPVQPVTVPRSIRHQHRQYALGNEAVDCFIRIQADGRMGFASRATQYCSISSSGLFFVSGTKRHVNHACVSAINARNPSVIALPMT